MAEDYSCGWIGQSDLYKNLEKKFGNMVKGQRVTETPSTPGFHVVRNIPEAVFISDNDQKVYRSGIRSMQRSSEGATIHSVSKAYED